MPTSQIDAISILDDRDLQDIDTLGDGRLGASPIPDLAAFLLERFALEIVTDSDIVSGYTSDCSNLPGGAEALCRPSDERECAVLLRACRATRLPVTISGGRTNLTGSATPKSGIVVSTSRMLNPGIVVDIQSRTATAPPGMFLEEMRDAVMEKSGRRLHFPVDPTSRKEANVGGAVSCNASGFTPGEMGSMRSWVRSLRVLLPNGFLVSATRGQYITENAAFHLVCPDGEIHWPVPTYTRPILKNASGPWSSPDGEMDFVDLMIGSEGLFGLVTGVSLDLAPLPSGHLDFFISLPQEHDAIVLLHGLLARLGGSLNRFSAFEYFGINAKAMMKHKDQFYFGTDDVGLYLQIPLYGEEAERDQNLCEWADLLTGGAAAIDADRILFLDTVAMLDLFFEARHSLPAKALEIAKHRGTYTIMTDTVVPAARFEEFLVYTNARLKKAGLDYLSFGHFGDAHLHFALLPEQDQLEMATAIYDEIVAQSADLGGVYSGEHGTGRRKRKDFLRCYGESAIEQVRRCKAAVDPDFLLNRGVVIET